MKALLALAAAVFVGVIAWNLSQPIAERWQDDNATARELAQLQIERQRLDLEQYRMRQAATLPARVLADYGLLLLLGGAALGAGWLIRDYYQQRRTPLVRYAAGLPVPRHMIEYGDPALLELMASALQLEGAAAIERARASQQVPASYSPHITVARTADETAAPAAPAQLTDSGKAAGELPPVTDMADLLGSFTPSKDRLLLALGPGGQQLTAPLKAMMHVALLGATGSGKSNLLRLIIPQLQRVGARVVLADPHYAPIDEDSGDDWRPIAERLWIPPASRGPEIRALLEWLIEELDQRLDRRKKQQPIGVPIFLAYDELPILVSLVDEAPEQLGRILREGRKVSMLCVGASQEFLVKVIGGSAGARDQYRTAFYLGGDKTSAAALLDLPARTIDDGPLGHGVALLRSAATPTAQIVRVPLASNTAIYRLLSGIQPADERHTQGPIDTTIEGEAYAVDMPESSQKVAADVCQNSAAESHKPGPESLRAAQLFISGKNPAEIVRELRGIKSNQGAAYQRALAEVHDLIRQGIGGAQL